MLPPTSPLLTPLEPLVSHCVLQPCADCNGWPVDFWDLDEDGCALLVNAYRQLLLVEPANDPIMAAVHEEARRNSIDLEALFLGEGHLEHVSEEQRTQFERNTRADLTELAAAASLIASQNVRIEDVVLPNIPKGSRTVSERGIDVMALSDNAFLTISHPRTSTYIGPAFEPDEQLYVASVKHTLDRAYGVCSDLVDSISDEALGDVYIGGQLRILSQRLQRPCVTLILCPENRRFHLTILAVAAFPPALKSAIEDQLTRRLPAREQLPTSHVRQLSVNGLETIHSMVSQGAGLVESVNESSSATSDEDVPDEWFDDEFWEGDILDG